MLLFINATKIELRYLINIIFIKYNKTLIRCKYVVVTQFWIHQDFLKCYFISIIIYKNPKKLRKRKIQKYIFLEATASFHKNWVNTGQNMSTRVKNEFQAVSGQNRHFRSKPSPPSQYGSHHVDQGKKWVSGRFRVKTVIFGQNRVHRVNTGPTMSTGVKNEFQVILGQNYYFRSLKLIFNG